jgi:hypothetical protein
MKLLCQALRVATVDTLSIVLALSMFVGLPTVSYRSLAQADLAAAVPEWWHAGQTQWARVVFHPQQFKLSFRAASAEPARAENESEPPRAAAWIGSSRGLVPY